MNVKTEVVQVIEFKDGLTHFKDVEARFYNGHLQWLRWKYRDGSTEYEIRCNSEGLKEFQKIINEIAEFSESSNKKIPEKIERLKSRKIQLNDIEN